MRHFRQVGFTLIELLVTLVILGLLVGLVGPQFFGKVDSSKVKTAKIQVDMVKMALRTYRLDAGIYPETLDVLWQRPSGAIRDSITHRRSLGTMACCTIALAITVGWDSAPCNIRTCACIR